MPAKSRKVSPKGQLFRTYQERAREAYENARDNYLEGMLGYAEDFQEQAADLYRQDRAKRCEAVGGFQIGSGVMASTVLFTLEHNYMKTLQDLQRAADDAYFKLLDAKEAAGPELQAARDNFSQANAELIQHPEYKASQIRLAEIDRLCGMTRVQLLKECEDRGIRVHRQAGLADMMNLLLEPKAPAIPAPTEVATVQYLLNAEVGEVQWMRAGEGFGSEGHQNAHDKTLILNRLDLRFSLVGLHWVHEHRSLTPDGLKQVTRLYCRVAPSF